MRYRMMIVIAAAAALAYYAMEHRAELSALPDSTSLILALRNLGLQNMGLQNNVASLRFNLSTAPEPPVCDTPITLKVHVADGKGRPVDGLMIEIDASMNGANHGSQHGTLRAKGNGNYEGKLELEMAGTWDVDFTATKNGRSDRQRFNLEVAGPQGSPLPRNPNDDDSEP